MNYAALFNSHGISNKTSSAYDNSPLVLSDHARAFSLLIELRPVSMCEIAPCVQPNNSATAGCESPFDSLHFCIGCFMCGIIPWLINMSIVAVLVKKYQMVIGCMDE